MNGSALIRCESRLVLALHLSMLHVRCESSSAIQRLSGFGRPLRIRIDLDLCSCIASPIWGKKCCHLAPMFPNTSYRVTHMQTTFEADSEAMQYWPPSRIRVRLNHRHKKCMGCSYLKQFFEIDTERNVQIDAILIWKLETYHLCLTFGVWNIEKSNL